MVVLTHEEMHWAVDHDYRIGRELNDAMRRRRKVGGPVPWPVRLPWFIKRNRTVHIARCLLHVACCMLHIVHIVCAAWCALHAACGLLHRAAAQVLRALGKKEKQRKDSANSVGIPHGMIGNHPYSPSRNGMYG